MACCAGCCEICAGGVTEGAGADCGAARRASALATIRAIKVEIDLRRTIMRIPESPRPDIEFRAIYPIATFVLPPITRSALHPSDSRKQLRGILPINKTLPFLVKIYTEQK